MKINEMICADAREVADAGLLQPSGVFLGLLNKGYLRHDGLEHVMAFAPIRPSWRRRHWSSPRVMASSYAVMIASRHCSLLC